MRTCLLIFIISALTCCVPTQKYSYQGYQEKLVSFNNVSLEQILLYWGQPNLEIPTTNSNIIYEYYTSPIIDPRYNKKYSETKIDILKGTLNSTPITQKIECTTRFLIDKNKKIISSTFYGRDCVAATKKAS